MKNISRKKKGNIKSTHSAENWNLRSTCQCFSLWWCTVEAGGGGFLQWVPFVPQFLNVLIKPCEKRENSRTHRNMWQLYFFSIMKCTTFLWTQLWRNNHVAHVKSSWVKASLFRNVAGESSSELCCTLDVWPVGTALKRHHHTEH